MNEIAKPQDPSVCKRIYGRKVAASSMAIPKGRRGKRKKVAERLVKKSFTYSFMGIY
jgi:hypothetical protein